MQNPNCDGAHCANEAGEVRTLPAGGGSNIILCKSCFCYEIKWRRDRNTALDKADRFPLPKWSGLKVYLPAITQKETGGVQPIIAANSSNGRIYSNWGLFEGGSRIAIVSVKSPEREHLLAERLADAYNELAALLAVAEAATMLLAAQDEDGRPHITSTGNQLRKTLSNLKTIRSKS